MSKTRSASPRANPADPKTPAEWQEAVDSATAARMVANCMMYGLLAGGPKINVERCDEILRRGQERGIRPSRPTIHLALDFVRAVNESASGE